MTKKIDIFDKPFKQFEKWFYEALEAKLIEPNAFTLSTVGRDLKPTQRTVLLKMYDEKGFIFFSDTNTKKSKHIDENPYVSAHFAWLGLERQVRIEGVVKKITKKESLKYLFLSKKGEQLGSWISHQSQIINSRTILEIKFDKMRKKFAKGEVSFPSILCAYRIIPSYFEFWQGDVNSLHKKITYELKHKSWESNKL